jgi:hypothetical protein
MSWPKGGKVPAKNTTEISPFLAEIERLMAQKGLEGLEDLYQQFMAQEPERIGNARWTLERFRLHATNEAGALYTKFMGPLVGALEATPRERARLFLAWVEDTTEPRHVA